jgi:TPR repeat protein
MNVACVHGSGGACNQLGMALDEGITLPRDAAAAAKDFGRACDLKVTGSCQSMVAVLKKSGEDVFLGPCGRGDGESCFLLASLYYAGAGVARDAARSASLFRQSCDDGWPRGCGGLGELYKAGQGVAADPGKAIDYFERACRSGIAASCYAVGGMYRARNDEALADTRLRQACEVSRQAAIDNAGFFHSGPIQPDAAALPFCGQ